MARAMILAAGRGERMRPLSDATPKPLLAVGGKPLIVWQIERLAAAGLVDIVVNVAYRSADIETALGDGARFGVRLQYSREPEPLEVAGGIATALPLLGEGVALIVSADVYVEFDYAAIATKMRAMEAATYPPHAHLVLVPNPSYHLRGDFVLRAGMLFNDGGTRATYANIGLYRTSLFQGITPNVKVSISPLYRDWIARGWVSGEMFSGRWANVGTPAELETLNGELRRDDSVRAAQ